MSRSPSRERRAQRAAAGHCSALLLVVSACGDANEVPLPQPGASVEMTPGQMPAAAPPAGGMQGAPTGGDMPEPMRGEGADESPELVGGEPEKPVSGETADPAGEEPPPVTMDPAPAIPPIAPPGFPAGSAPRLVPLQFVGPITQRPVQFNVYLPPGYDSSAAPYPVLYDLHGLTDSRDTNPGPVISSLEAAMRSQVIGPLIVVFPQGFPEAYWADTSDGRPGETQVIRELIPYIDANFRTLAQRERRAVSGFSMGGFGAFAYVTKHPELFSVGIGYDSALDTWQTLVGRRAYIASAAFDSDENLFDQISPWSNASRNAALLTTSTRLRGVTGAQYRDFNVAFRDHLAGLGIPYDFVETDCEHFYGCPIERGGRDSWSLLQAAFSQPRAAQ